MLRVALHCFIAVAVVSLSPERCFAAGGSSGKIKPIIIEPEDYFTVSVQVKVGKKTVTQDVACLVKTKRPGVVKPKGNKYAYTSYAALVKQLVARRTSSKKLELYKKLARVKDCKSETGNPGNPSPQSDFLSMERYTGVFGREQAKALFDRFAFGATPERIDQAVADGLDVTVQKLTTWTDEPNIAAEFQELLCDGREANDPNNEQCDPTDPNDFFADGLKYGYYNGAIYSSNVYFYRMWMFLHDKFMAGVTRGVTGCSKHFLIEHYNLLMNSARSGDFKEFNRQYISDGLNLIALNLKTSTKFNPNQDFAREIMERGTIGKATIDLAAIPNYGEDTIAEMSRVFTGFKLVTQNVSGHNVCYGAYVTDLHDTGPKTIFRGTQYERVVYEPNDVVEALFNMPQTSERLANQLWIQFVNPYATPEALRNLAKIVRDKNYNINEVVKVMMVSRAIYAPKSYKSLTKDPIEMVLSLLRQTKIPYSYQRINALLGDLDQVPLNPPTVFGWSDPSALETVDEFHSLAWANGLKGPIFQNLQDLKEDEGYDFWATLLYSIPSNAETARSVAQSFADRLTVPLTEPQIQALITYLNYDMYACYQGEMCQNQPRFGYKMIRNQLDIDPAADGRHGYKMQGALAALASTVEFRLKS